MINLKGHIKSLKSSEDRMGDLVRLVTLEVVGDFQGLHEYEQKPLDIKIEVENIT